MRRLNRKMVVIIENNSRVKSKTKTESVSGALILRNANEIHPTVEIVEKRIGDEIV